MKVSIELEFDTPEHAIVALNHISELRKGNFGETRTAPTSTKKGDNNVDPVPAKTPEKKKRTPRKPADAKAIPSLADVQAAVKSIFTKHGAVKALELLQTFKVERAAELPNEDRAKFIAEAEAL